MNLDALCARTAVLLYSILGSAVGNRKACLMSPFYRILVAISKFLILSRISKYDFNQICIEFSSAIGVGLVNEDRMRYLVSVVQIFYHMDNALELLVRPLTQSIPHSRWENDSCVWSAGHALTYNNQAIFSEACPSGLMMMLSRTLENYCSKSFNLNSQT
jgi:hypothetical protein